MSGDLSDLAQAEAEAMARRAALKLQTISFWETRNGDDWVVTVGHDEATGIAVTRKIPADADADRVRGIATMARLELARVLRNIASNLERLTLAYPFDP